MDVNQSPADVQRIGRIVEPERLLPISKVKDQVGFGTSYLYELIKQRKFPEPLKIGNASRWRESQVQEWIHNQIEGNSSGKHAEVRT
ncbi:hypothetical protein C7H79_02765 [Nitrosomonas supralitoralis]|uniref:Transcriptional regulator, AlpA family n=2 Tax=Nitrosomonas supralitoralis TaxID=2116706 RepID=A0A2P7NYJ9_9PROT|nr:hypothetical protein C7H79_02765 [Nitrosomonas supralitoralis]